MDHSSHHASAARDINSNCQSDLETAQVNPQDHHHEVAEHGVAEHRAAENRTAEHGVAEHGTAELSRPCPSTVAHADSSSIAQSHTHALMGAGANIQRQHAWFAIVGFCVALFKFLHDFARPPIRVPHSLWANSMIVLGILLLIYVE
jgi:hypothetical protein